MSIEPDLPLGERVAVFRRRLGLSQVELAARVGRSESWLSQVERGVRAVDRVSVLTRLATALDVPVADLSPDQPMAEVPETRGAPYIDDLRLLLSGRPALAVVLGSEEPVALSSDEAQAMRSECWELAHESRYRELATLLHRVIPALESAVHALPVRRRRQPQEALADVYLAASAVLAKLDEAEGAWLAADRAGFVAEAIGDAALVAATQHRLALGLLSTQRTDQSRHVAERAVAALTPLMDAPSPELLSVFGALHLVLAIASARDGQRAAAREHLAVAADAAARIGEDRNDFETEFGPTNVAVHAVAAAIELGDAGEALDRAQEIDSATLSNERRSRLLIDESRAYDQLRRPADALRCLLEAEQLSPQQVEDHVLVRQVARSLLQQAGRRPSPELRAFAQRIGAAE